MVSRGDWMKCSLLIIMYVLLGVSAWCNPSPRSLSGLNVPSFVADWLKERPLCRDLPKPSQPTYACLCQNHADRCLAAAREGISRASGRCYSLLRTFAADPDRADDLTRQARRCLKRSFRSPFRRANLPVPALRIDSS